MKYEKCDPEFKEEGRPYSGKVHVHRGKVICEDCLVDMGVSLDEATPYQTYIETRTDIGRVPSFCLGVVCSKRNRG